ncbi:MAG: nucleotidyl transferase AbiEii/AbiGii toxin family protein [Rhodanobacter thiooxydans]|nr:nucleotidyl transferase AbiEii/AbiGii toxin family protein [Rhodanobacter thiooxydans]
MDSDLLTRAKCYFGGGTAIALKLGEYRESVDVDFLCSDKAGYRLLRTTITPPTLGAVLRSPIRHLRDVRTQRDKISTFLEVDEVPVRVEFVLEGRIDIDGALDPELCVPVLHRDDMYAEKLLANADRALDRSQMSRDLIDLAMMIKAWGPIPATALKKAEGAYGRSIYDYFDRGLERLRDDRYRDECLKAMGMTPSLGAGIIATLDQQQSRQSSTG